LKVNFTFSGWSWTEHKTQALTGVTKQ